MLPDIVTPAERRLAALVFTLALIGALARGGRTVSPAVDAWLSDVADTAAVVPDTGSVPASPPPPAAGPRAAGETGSPAPEAPALIDPNRADLETLCRLPGVGPVLARRILEDRRRNGPYRSVEDLRRVSGIGTVTLQRLRPRLVVGGGPGG